MAGDDAAGASVEAEAIQPELACSALEAAPDAVFWFTPGSRFVYVNPAACRVLGYGRDELLGMSVADIDPGHAGPVFDGTWQRLRSEGAIRLESTHRRKDGQEFPVEISASHLMHGDAEYGCAIARDISARAAAAGDDDKLEALGQLSGRVAHDFNNILASILGFTDLTLLRLHTGEADDVKAYLREIKIAGERGKGLAERMVHFSRDLAGSYQSADLQPLVRDIVERLRGEGGQR